MIIGHSVLKVPARGGVLRLPSGGCSLLRDETGDSARPRQRVKHQQIIGLCALHVSAEFCQGIALKEQAQAPGCVGVTGLVVPLCLRILRAGRPDGKIGAPGMLIP